MEIKNRKYENSSKNNYKMNYNQDNLFGKKIISSIGFDEQEMIRDILYLHAKGKDIDCDPTFSKGEFYKHGIKKPKYIFDKYPQCKNTIQADSYNIPLPNNSCEVIMFDPPFIWGKGENAMTNRFSQFESFEELKSMYSLSLIEFNRLLKKDGIIILKCQDIAWSGKNYFIHCFLKDEAEKIGLYQKDLFVLISKRRVVYKSKKQHHARKFHSYYLIFEKSKKKINYKV